MVSVELFVFWRTAKSIAKLSAGHGISEITVRGQCLQKSVVANSKRYIYAALGYVETSR